MSGGHEAKLPQMAVGCEMGAGYRKGLKSSAWLFLPLCSLIAAMSGGLWPSQRGPVWWGDDTATRQGAEHEGYVR